MTSRSREKVKQGVTKSHDIIFFYNYFQTSFAMGAVGGAAAAAAAVVGSAAAAANIAYTAGSCGPANGVLARMCGITPSNPIGTGWEIAIGVSDVT